MSAAPLVLFAAALLRVPARRMRALARGDDAALRDWLANESATRLAEARRDARLALARIEQARARVVALGDDAYPVGLLDLSDPPAFLVVRGTLAAATWRAGTAIVGTRSPDAASLAIARRLARHATAPIMSGLARGIDAAAHESALDAGVPTYAYVGHGIGATYPPEHRELEERIVAAGGAILSEALPDEPVTRWSFVRRDRLQAAHAASVVLVMSDAGGGAMHALRVAKTLGRPRYAVEPLDDPTYGGNVAALTDGALAIPRTAVEDRAALSGGDVRP